MKFGVRKPNLKKTVKAKTTGKLKRKGKASVNPLYGKKGVGMIKNPKKSMYNKVYNRTTVSANPIRIYSSTKQSSRQSTLSQADSIAYRKKKQFEKEVPVKNTIEKWLRRLLEKNFDGTKVIQQTVVTEEYTHLEVETIQKEAEEQLTRYKQSIRYATETVNADVFFSNLDEAEEALSQTTYYIRSYSFLIKENGNVVETYHQFLNEKDSLIKQFLHRHFQYSVESANQLKTDRGKRNRLEANYTELTDCFPHLSKEMIETVNTIWTTVIPENRLKEV